MNKKEFKKKDPEHGKRPNQKLKPFLIMRYLQRYTDKLNPINANGLVDEMIDTYGIYAERRSIYRDIAEINKVYIMEKYGLNVQKAENYLKNCDESEKAVVYNPNKKGFYWHDRDYSENDIFLLAESINSFKFISKREAKRFIDKITNTYLSEHQKQSIVQSVFLVDRSRTNRNDMIETIKIINNAMRTLIKDKPHTPHKISFHYLKYSINNVKEQVKRRKGNEYIVSPYKLIVNEGNYYLLAYNDNSKKMLTYRVDRMKDVIELDEERIGEEEFKKITNLNEYIQERFNMFDGKRERVEIQFTNNLLDTFVERFGKDKRFFKKDDWHCSISTYVEVSEPFFGWLCGFGNKVKILEPESVKADYLKHLEKVIKKQSE